MSTYITNVIKERIYLSSIIGRKVALQQKKPGEFLGLCPFHKEKTPSFHVNDNQGYYHCFGCGVHGDIFSFRMELESLPFKEVLAELAQEAGVELPSTPQKNEEYNLSTKLYSIYKMVTTYYKEKLFSAEGAEALAYLRKRGLKPAIIEKYQLGYAPIQHEEIEKLLVANFNTSEIEQSKILLEGNFGRYNPFKGRVIFPIMNVSGEVVAFGGRSIDGSNPKYLNSTETLIFQKSNQLYGFNFAKKNSYKSGKILVVEGYMDVLSLANYNIEYAVAPLGTSFTHNQLDTLWQVNPIPTICFDADLPGQKAALRAAYEALPFLQPDKTLEFMQLKGGKDPDEILLNYDKDYFLDLISKALPISQVLFEEQVNKEPLITPESKARLKDRLTNLTKKIENKELAKDYNNFFKNAFYEKFRFKKNQSSRSPLFKIYKNIEIDEQEILLLLAIIKKYPILLFDEELVELLNRLEINSKDLDKKRCSILCLTEYTVLEDMQSALNRILDTKLFSSVDQKGLEAFLHSKNSIEQAKLGMQRIYNLSHLKAISKQISEMVSYLQINQSEEFLERLQFLKKEEEKIKHELNIIHA